MKKCLLLAVLAGCGGGIEATDAADDTAEVSSELYTRSRNCASKTNYGTGSWLGLYGGQYYGLPLTRLQCTRFCATCGRTVADFRNVGSPVGISMCSCK
jgi:hypothetical protein